jgi:hypothetical protein
MIDQVVGQRCFMAHDKPAPAVVGSLCDHHYAAVREQLQDCMEMYAILPEFLLPGSTPPDDGSKHTKKGTIPAPIRLDVLALYDPRNATDLEWSYESNWDPAKGKLTGNGSDIPTFDAWLDGWAQYIREGRHMGDENADRSVTGNTWLIRNHLGWLAGDDWLPQFVRELRHAHRALEVGIGKSPKRPLGKCYLEFNDKECEGSIWLSDDAKGARCGRCKMTWTGIELIRLRLALEMTA